MEYIAHIDEKDKKRIQTVKNHWKERQNFQENLRENLGKKTGVTVMGCYMILESILWIPEKDHRGK